MPGKMARSDPRPSVRVTRGAGSGRHLAFVLQEGRENGTLMPVWGSSGESRSLRHPRLLLSFYDFEGLLWCCVATFLPSPRGEILLGCQPVEGMGCRTSEVLARPRIVLTPRADYIQPDA